MNLASEALDPAILLNSTRNLRIVYLGLIALLLLASIASAIIRPGHFRSICFAALLMLDLMLFLVPSLEGYATLSQLAFAILAVLAALVVAPGKTGRILGFFLALSVLMLGWEVSKSLADSVKYKLLLPQQSWTYQTRPSLEDALAALEAGDVVAVVADRKDLDDLMPPHPAKGDEDDTLPYDKLRYLRVLDRAQGFGFLPVFPAFPGRLSLAIRDDDIGKISGVRDVVGREIAAVEGDFADIKFLSVPRNLVLLDLRILNDLNLPHLQMIAEAFLQPARRNGELLLLRILSDAGIYTFSEAIFGFLFGALLGFVLGAVFAHSRLMERGLLPYVVASQTVPILAIAPMVVIWLGASQLSVAVIAAYLTFFPGHDQYYARLAIPGAGASRIDALVRGNALDDHVEAALSGRLALYFYRLESVGNGECGRRNHWRVTVRYRRWTGASNSRFQFRLQHDFDAKVVGVYRYGGYRWHSVFCYGQHGRAVRIAWLYSHPGLG